MSKCQEVEGKAICGHHSTRTATAHTWLHFLQTLSEQYTGVSWGLCLYCPRTHPQADMRLHHVSILYLSKHTTAWTFSLFTGLCLTSLWAGQSIIREPVRSTEAQSRALGGLWPGTKHHPCIQGTQSDNYRTHMCTMDYRTYMCTMDYRTHMCTMDCRIHMCTMDCKTHMCTMD